MKAWVLHNIGDIRFEDIDKPEPGPGEVLVRVMAAGICGSDIPRTFDTGAHKMPIIIGHEFSGIVAETGEGVDPALMGARVGVFPLIPCRKCPQCLSERYELCRDYDYLGSRSNGAFAEYVKVPADNLIKLPDSVSFEEAAMLEPMAVAVHAIRGILDEDELNGNGAGTNKVKDLKVAVYGLGTIGMFVTMFLKAAGFDNLILLGNKQKQKEMIVSMGIPESCYHDGASNEALKLINNKGGADIIYECVGSQACYAGAVDITAPTGRVMLIGNPGSDMTLNRNTYWKILRNSLTLKGTWNSSFTGKDDDDWHYVLNLLGDGTVDPKRFITHRFPLEGLKQGLDIMHEKKEEYGKIVTLN
ncbi:MAG: galactitol-1-phosphate 5-dehydrogenase [Lachnospiraceae bacterium]|nr:galactitol-1-phosphate 5-dehydrogenase [Lachnospiraceae bacterium]